MKLRAFFVSIGIMAGITLATAHNRTPELIRPVCSETMDQKVSPEKIRDLIGRMKDQLDKNNETFPERIKEVETYAESCPDSASAALLHSMIAEMYYNYYMWNRWSIDERTQLTGYVPDDLREWSKNLFDEKIRLELNRSLQPDKLLQTSDIKSYQQLLTTETKASRLYPTLYDFLMARAIDIAPDSSYFRQWEQHLKTTNQPELWMPVRIRQLQYLKQQRIITDEELTKELKQLIATYDHLPIANEARDALADQLSAYNWNRPDNLRDTVWQEIVELCKTGIQKHPKAAATAKLRNRLNNLTEPFVGATFPNQIYPGKPLEIRLRYRNVEQIKVSIYKSLRQPEQAWSHMANPQKMCGALVKEFTLTGDIANSYTEKDSLFTLPANLPVGLYECSVKVPDSPIVDRHCFSVSRLATLYRNLFSRRKEVLITDAESGKPMAGVKVYYYCPAKGSGLPERAGEVRTDSQGLAQLPQLRNLECLRPVVADDSSSVWSPVYGSYPDLANNRARSELTLYTDRGLYRPGQNIFFKGVVTSLYGDRLELVTDQTVEITLRNPQGEEIGKRSFTTDRFGAIHGEFTLPKGGMNGRYSLNSNYGYAQSVQVEEYKRPSFLLEMEPIAHEVAFGEELTLRGKANTFSGIKLTEGKVTWQITRRPYGLRYYMPNPFDHSYQQVAEGETTVDGNGCFTIPFTPQLENLNHLPDRPLAQNYELTARMTDSKGETQSCSFLFTAANVGITLQIEMAEKMEVSEAKAKFVAQTMNQHLTEAQGDYTLYALSPEPAKSTDSWGEKVYPILKTVAQGQFSSRESWGSDRFESLASGRYRLELRTQDSQGRKVTAHRTFVLYRKSDTHPPVFAEMWNENKPVECLPNEKAELLIGTSYRDAYLLYELYSHDAKPIHQEWVQLSHANRLFSIPFLPLYGPGITATFTLVKEGKMYAIQKPIRLKQPDRTLRIVPQTFRDHLLPGSSEQWSFRIENSDSTATEAQLLASMYDTSLDQLQPFRWGLLPQFFQTLHSPGFKEGSSFEQHSDYHSANWQRYDYEAPLFPQLDWQDVLNHWQRIRSRNLSLRGGGVRMLAKNAAPQAFDVVEITEDCAAADVLYESSVESTVTGSVGPQNQMEKISPATLRKNFAETAFFFPALVTNERGEVSFSFTMPESNTTWKLQLLAHTESLKQGYWNQEVQTSKPLMVLPNLPRFMRQGDEVTISTQLINQTEQELTGKVRLELFDPEQESTTECLSRHHKPFTLRAGEQQTVQWSLSVPDGLSLAGCRIVAESEEGSDGEQHLIPILSNQLLLTESTPFYLMGNNEERLNLKANRGEKPLRYVIEMSGNPVWQAVQALPTLTTPERNDILSWFASYYSNTLATALVEAHPRIRQMITVWSEQGGNATTLLSNLEKNEELKNLLLEETPWVMEAKDESEQKRRLSLLFDLNRAASERENALQKLLEEQLPDGGWSWFKGLYANRSITLSILRGMAQLVELKAVEYGQAEREMQMRALNYLDRQIEKDFEWLQKHNTQRDKVVPSPEQIDYLYVRSLYRDVPELGSAREAIRFYTAQAARHWKKLDLYGKGETALLLHRNGDRNRAEQIMTWLRKTVTTNSAKGMYWANNRRDNNYFTSPIETHCLLMEAFRTFRASTEEMDRMKQWLLNQKRTQRWETEPATLNAIYAIIESGSDWLSQPNVCTVQWGNYTFSTEQGETGTGYLKKTFAPDELKELQSQPITVRKEGKAPAWGALYRQYFQSIDRISSHKGALQIEKKLFVEENSDNGPQLRPLQADEALHTGDKVVVRLVIRSDREMHFVALKDLRAGCFEPADVLSGVEFREGLSYYRSPKDVSEQFFFELLPQGTFVLEYRCYVSRPGNYAAGISTLQCLYAPEFVTHSEGSRLRVEE